MLFLASVLILDYFIALKVMLWRTTPISKPVSQYSSAKTCLLTGNSPGILLFSSQSKRGNMKLKAATYEHSGKVSLIFECEK